MTKNYSKFVEISRYSSSFFTIFRSKFPKASKAIFEMGSSRMERENKSFKNVFVFSQWLLMFHNLNKKIITSRCFLNRKCLFLRGSFSEKRNFLSICSTWKYFSARWFLFVLCGTNFVNTQGESYFCRIYREFSLANVVRARKENS